MDVTGFLKQYLNFGSSQYLSYFPTYNLTYRRHFNSGNLRAKIGGSYSDNQVAPINSNDSTKYYDLASSLYQSIGWEFCENLSKRWQVFYGADARTSVVFSKGNQEYENDYYVYGESSRAQVFAIAPLLGIRFRLTKRLSILTEASYSINWEKDNSNTYYTLVPSPIPPYPPPTAPKSVTQSLTKTYTAFSQPLSVFIDFTL